MEYKLYLTQEENGTIVEAFKTRRKALMSLKRLSVHEFDKGYFTGKLDVLKKVEQQLSDCFSDTLTIDRDSWKEIYIALHVRAEDVRESLKDSVLNPIEEKKARDLINRIKVDLRLDFEESSLMLSPLHSGLYTIDDLRKMLKQWEQSIEDSFGYIPGENELRAIESFINRIQEGTLKP